MKLLDALKIIIGLHEAGTSDRFSRHNKIILVVKCLHLSKNGKCPRENGDEKLSGFNRFVREKCNDC